MGFWEDIGFGESDSEKRAKENGEVLYNSGPGTSDVGRTDGAGDNPLVDPYAGTPYASHGFNQVWDGASGVRDQRDFMYGRDPNYASATRDRTLAQGKANQQELSRVGSSAQADMAGLGGDAQRTMSGIAGQQGAYGRNMGDTVAGYAPTVASYGDRAAAYGNYAAGRGAVRLDSENQNGALDRSMSNADRLALLEATEGPSAAQAQLRAGLNSAKAQNLSLARSGRGAGGGASAMRAAIAGNSTLGTQAVNQAAALRAQENAAWRSRQAGNLGAASSIQQGAGAQYGQQATTQAQLEQANRAQNDSTMLAGTQAGMTGAQGAADVAAKGAAVGQAGYRDAANSTNAGYNAQIGATGQGYNAQIAATTAGQNQGWQGEAAADNAMNRQNQNDLTYENTLTQEEGIRNGLAIDGRKADTADRNSWIAAGGAMLAAMSDERQKVKLSSAAYGNPYGRTGAPGSIVKKKPDDSEVVPDFRKVPDHVYAYKNPALPGAQPGVQVGGMAQDIERVLPNAVENTPNGKMVKTDRVTLALPGAVGDLQKRVDELESGHRGAVSSDRKKKDLIDASGYQSGLEHKSQATQDRERAAGYSRRRFDQLDAMPYDPQAKDVEPNARRSFGRSFTSSMLDAAAFPVRAVGKGLEAAGVPNAAANLDGREAAEGIEWLASGRKREPADIHREERRTQADNPSASLAGEIAGGAIGSAPTGALTARLSPAVGGVLRLGREEEKRAATRLAAHRNAAELESFMNKDRAVASAYERGLPLPPEKAASVAPVVSGANRALQDVARSGAAYGGRNYRGENIPPEQLQKILQRNELENEHIWSSSFEPDAAKAFAKKGPGVPVLYEIEGGAAVPVDEAPWSNTYDELLTPSRTKFRVSGVHDDDGVKVIRLRGGN